MRMKKDPGLTVSRLLDGKHELDSCCCCLCLLLSLLLPRVSPLVSLQSLVSRDSHALPPPAYSHPVAAVPVGLIGSFYLHTSRSKRRDEPRHELRASLLPPPL